ncbi:MAG: hypothetical protein ABIE03_00235 [Patescibacteria group bacterium]|nr:hypothetical protein [Patescibacteria group bacterium]
MFYDDDETASPHPMGAPVWLVSEETAIIQNHGQEMLFTVQEVLKRWGRLTFWTLDMRQGYATEAPFLLTPYGFDPTRSETLNETIALSTLGREPIEEIVAIDRELEVELPDLPPAQRRLTAFGIRIYRETERELERVLRRFPRQERGKVLREIRDIFGIIDAETTQSIAKGRIHRMSDNSHAHDGKVPDHVDTAVHARFEELDLRWLYRNHQKHTALADVISDEVPTSLQVIQKSRLDSH